MSWAAMRLRSDRIALRACNAKSLDIVIGRAAACIVRAMARRLAALVGWIASLVACDKHDPAPADTAMTSSAVAPQGEPKPVHVTQAEYGEKWPFTVPEGDIECVDRVAMVFVAGGKRYALNGMAKSRADSIRPIWRDLEPGSPMKVNLGPILERGLDACPDLKTLGKKQP